MSGRPKTELKPEGESVVTKDAMHIHRRTTETDNRDLTSDDFNELFRLLQRGKMNEKKSTNQDPSDELTSEVYSAQGDCLTSLRQTVSTLLQTAGLPDPFTIVITNEDNWRVLPDNWQDISNDDRARSLKKCEGIELGWAFATRVVAALSDQYFAAEIAARIWTVEATPGRNHGDTLLRIGFLAGQWNSRKHMSSVTRGKKVRAGASDGGTARGIALAADKQSRIAEMKRLIAGGKSERRAAEIVAKRGFGPSADANRKMMARAKKDPRWVE